MASRAARTSRSGGMADPTVTQSASQTVIDRTWSGAGTEMSGLLYASARIVRWATIKETVIGPRVSPPRHRRGRHGAVGRDVAAEVEIEPAEAPDFDLDAGAGGPLLVHPPWRAYALPSSARRSNRSTGNSSTTVLSSNRNLNETGIQVASSQINR
jgi:hypothetical protein